MLLEIKGYFYRVSAPISLPGGVSNHKVEDDFAATVNKGVTEKHPLSKPTSFSDDAVEPETYKASSEQVAAPVSVSAVQNHTQDVISAHISQPIVNNHPAELQSSTFGRHDPSLISASHGSSSSDQGMLAFLFVNLWFTSEYSSK